MNIALELLASLGLFALAMGLVATFIWATDKTRKLRAAHERRRFARQPWDADPHAGRRKN